MNRKSKKTERLGEIKNNYFGSPMKITEYYDARNIIIEFQDEYKYKTHTSYENFKKGKVKNPYDKTVFGVGYLGAGKYKTIDENKKHTKVYQIWVSMLQRCYDPYFLNKETTYIDCYVCEEWHNFQNFAKWYEENYYEVDGERMELDKDILCKGNKIYSPETCVLVPQRINCLFVKSNQIRGSYPIGVNYHKGNNALGVSCRILDENKKRKKKYLGQFPLNRPFQAFYTYKIFKEEYIKQTADEYKDLIPEKLYKAMYRYQVEIND